MRHQLTSQQAGGILQLVGDLLLQGATPEEVGRAVGMLVDQLVAFDQVVKGPGGEALEAMDGPVLVAVATFIARVFPGRAKRFAQAKAGGEV